MRPAPPVTYLAALLSSLRSSGLTPSPGVGSAWGIQGRDSSSLHHHHHHHHHHHVHRCGVGGRRQDAMASPLSLMTAGMEVPAGARLARLTAPEPLLHYNFPSEADTLAYVDALKHSDLSDWRSLQEVAARAGAGSCSGAVTTSVLTALYLLGLFNLCVVSPASCCVPPAASRRRRSSMDATLPPLLNNLQYNLSSLSLEQFRLLPHVSTPDGGRIPLHISAVEQVRKLWDSNPRLLSSVSCSSPIQSVRSSFISLSGVASGIILAYSVAQLNQCYPDHPSHPHRPPKIWFFPIPKAATQSRYPVPMIPVDIPVSGEDEEEDGCQRDEVPLGSDRCAQLLSSNTCPYRHWVLLNSDTRTGECVPRLCADNFVYVETDQMCHDVNEVGICPGNRRLYLTAYGTAVCDCPEGMFPGPNDSCYFLYEKAYCRRGLVLQFERGTKTLTCRPDPCSHVNSQLWPDDLPYAPRPKDGFCYQFNEQGPCKRGQRFGYDTDKLEATCVSLQEAGLARPRRSFMYQQMSFPASQDRQYNHYQVSYIIMNGTTWDLQVKEIKRTKRDLTSSRQGEAPHLSSGHLVIPFIDTRRFPRNVHPPRRPHWVGRKHSWRGGDRARRVHAIRHMRGAAKTRMLRSQSSRHFRSDPHSRARLKSRRMTRGRTRLSRETSVDSEMYQDIGSVVKVNAASGSRPVGGPQSASLAAHTRPVRKVSPRRRRVGTRQSSKRRKGRKRGKGRRKKKGRKRKRKKKGRRRGHRRQKLHGSRNSTRTRGKKRKKNPNLPFRVPTTLPPIVTKPKQDTNTSDAEGEEKEEEEEEEEEEEDMELSSSEMSLPKYLRHRGRRQLGEGGGIIQAPLLSACKPGAKRDYNYKCRPKFIPQGRDRRRVAGVNVGPRRPTISCPKGTRLDPRGRCQQIG